MKLLIGLGNPGFRYKKTRHNAGFLAIDYIQKNISGFSKWKLNKNFQAEISKNNDLNITLAKPLNYMNKSGETTKSITKNLEIEAGNLFVMHDDFDLLLGEFKIEPNRGSAGHKGVQSIIDALGTNDFWRLRIGIRPKPAGTKSLYRDLVPAGSEIKAEDFVLKKFTREEKALIEKIIPEAIKTLFLSF